MVVKFGEHIYITSRIHEKDKHLCDIFKTREVKDLNIKFCKYVLAAEKKSTNIAIISEFELGRNHLYFSILCNFKHL